MVNITPEEAKLWKDKFIAEPHSNGLGYDFKDLPEKPIVESDKMRYNSLSETPEEKERNFLIRNYLESPNLLQEIDAELDKKIVGENDSRKVIFLIANMRNVENLNKGTDNLIVNALSGTGKDHVVGSVFDLIPSQEKEELIRTTPKVLAYTRNRKLFGGKK